MDSLDPFGLSPLAEAIKRLIGALSNANTANDTRKAVQEYKQLKEKVRSLDEQLQELNEMDSQRVPSQYGPPQYGPPQYGPPQYGPPQRRPSQRVPYSRPGVPPSRSGATSPPSYPTPGNGNEISGNDGTFRGGGYIPGTTTWVPGEDSWQPGDGVPENVILNIPITTGRFPRSDTNDQLCP